MMSNLSRTALTVIGITDKDSKAISLRFHSSPCCKQQPEDWDADRRDIAALPLFLAGSQLLMSIVYLNQPSPHLTSLAPLIAPPRLATSEKASRSIVSRQHDAMTSHHGYRLPSKWQHSCESASKVCGCAPPSASWCGKRSARRSYKVCCLWPSTGASASWLHCGCRYHILTCAKFSNFCCLLAAS